MGYNDCDARSKPLRVETVRGEPYYVGGRKLVPVARVVSFGRASGTVGSDRVSGWGGGFASVTPLAVLDETADGERRIPTTDATATALRGLLVAAAATVLFFAIVRKLADW